MGKIRLDKYLAEMSVGSRSEVKQMIRKGRVKLNTNVVKKPETKVDTDADVIEVDGKKISFVQEEYIMLHKPAGVVSATTDAKDQTVLDLIKDNKRKDLFPAGRLDKDTEGLLLITSDGALAHEMLSPQKHVDKVYYARIQGIVTEEDRKVFTEGLDIGEKKKTLPAELKIITSDTVSEVEITIREGKFHQIKRMFRAVDKTVVYLKRLTFGPLSLDESLKPGEYRYLTEDEIKRIKGDINE